MDTVYIEGVTRRLWVLVVHACVEASSQDIILGIDAMRAKTL